MQRREFIAGLGGAAAWPVMARAQQPERVRRIAVLNGTAPTGQTPATYDAFLRRLGELGWTDGRNVRVEVRYANSNPELMRSYGTELAGNSRTYFSFKAIRRSRLCSHWRAIRRSSSCRSPIQLAAGSSRALRGPAAISQVSRISSLRWAASGCRRSSRSNVDHAAALFHPETPANVAFWREALAAMPEVGINVMAAGVYDASEVERAITAVAAQPNGGLVVYPHTVTEVHLRLIIELAGKYRLPAVYPFRYHAEAGGLLSYGVDALDLVPRAANYVDRCVAPIPASYRSRRRPNSSL
jgi:putative tryptophan/tyrosine transport system substrate-binding protein